MPASELHLKKLAASSGKRSSAYLAKILFYGAIIALAVIGGFAIDVLGIGSLDDLEIDTGRFFRRSGCCYLLQF